eukprot:evm.model.scf_9.1 EVM.evm.TU.scf_9.1   scf_9:20302-21821(-)
MFVAEWSRIHPRWLPHKNQSSGFNIAILKLPKPSNQSVPKLLFDHFKLRTGQNLAGLGWGPSGNGPTLGGHIFSTLKIEFQEFVDIFDCSRSTLWGERIEGNTVCGLNARREASCIVDSGSPLVLLDSPRYDIEQGNPELDFVAGLNIDGGACGAAHKPDIYVDIREHRHWIHENIRPPGAMHNEL